MKLAFAVMWVICFEDFLESTLRSRAPLRLEKIARREPNSSRRYGEAFATVFKFARTQSDKEPPFTFIRARATKYEIMSFDYYGESENLLCNEHKLKS